MSVQERLVYEWLEFINIHMFNYHIVHLQIRLWIQRRVSGKVCFTCKLLIRIYSYIYSYIRNDSLSKSMRQQQTKNTPLIAMCLNRFCAFLFTNILCVSFGLKLISNLTMPLLTIQPENILSWGAWRFCMCTRRFSESQHTGPANQSEPIAYFC